MVNFDTEETIGILYKTYQKTKQLTFQELETSIEKLAVVKEEDGFTHMAEIVFSLLTEKIVDSKNQVSECKNCLDMVRRENILLEEGWIYFKLYGTGEKENEILSRYLPELIERLNQPKHFFIRYSDSIGRHLRIRIKFKNSKEAAEKILDITNWVQNLIAQRIVNNIVFDTYKRENNRYGGNFLIETYETVFFDDSVFVEKVLAESDFTEKKNLEKWYMFGICKCQYKNDQKVENKNVHFPRSTPQLVIL